MYKLLLCWRYLRTRYIALASVISVTLGVATLIVVNSVMSGFTTEMQDRIHGIFSDVTVDSVSLGGMRDAQWHMEQIRRVAGDSIEGMTPTVVVPGMLNYQYGGEWVTRQVQIIGIDPNTQNGVSDFGKYLQHPENRRQMSFELRERGYDVRDHQGGPDAPEREQMAEAGWKHRRRMVEARAFQQRLQGMGAPSSVPPQASGPQPPPSSGPTESGPPVNPFAAKIEADQFDPAKKTDDGIVLGWALAGYRDRKGKDRFLLLPGDDVKITLPTAGIPPKFPSDTFTVVDLYESKMSEYDASFVFVPIRVLQEMRGMYDYMGDTKQYFVSSIQVKLKQGVDGTEFRDKLRAAFPEDRYRVSTWRDKQGALLAAVQMETAILNVLLFMIIAVAGFGILAIFLMIVVEKTRDIGILKSLGASGRGVMGIFLSYGLSLGAVGSGAGMVLGLLFVKYINQIADLLGWITGRPVFDPSIYYFYKIPAIVNPVTIAWIVSGAMVIAVLASVLPALRAATLHPVEALRYE